MAVTRVSTATDGTQANSSSFNPSLSTDGTKVAFYSNSTNLVPGDTNDQGDLFVKDLATGAITLVSTAADGTQGTAASGFESSLSADGSKVAFVSNSSNLVPGDTNAQGDIFIKDVGTGAIVRVSTAADGTAGNGPSSDPLLSALGTKVAFESNATNLVPNDTNDDRDIFVKDVNTGAIVRVSTAADGTQGNADSNNASLSADGGKVAFESVANNLVPDDTNLVTDVFVKDVNTGAIIRVSTAADGTQGNGASGGASLSADGAKVAFASTSSNLVPTDTNNQNDVFVKDVNTGAITLVSAAADGTKGNGFSASPFLSADGTKVAFVSDSSNLVDGDTNGQFDIFVKDLATGGIVRVTPDGAQSDNGSFVPSLSGDGSNVAFDSGATNYVPGDTNEQSDVFVAQPPCYCTGTLIRTTRGDVAVEDLRIGDRVVTASGQKRPIKWIGTRAYAGRFANANPDVLPVRFRAGSLAEGVPARDLWVSPKHAMFLDGVLIPAEQLVNGVSIVKAERVERVEYWHVELDSHDVLIAEGAQSESFVDDGGRGIFHNARDYAALYPEAERVEAIYCAPRVEDGYALEAVRRRLAERACLPVAAAECLGALRGWVEGCDGTTVWGWAQDAAHPDAPVCLEVLVDGAVAGLVHAEAYRGDLAAAGIGDGRHAFSLRLPAPLSHTAAHEVAVRRSGDGARLAGALQVGPSLPVAA